MSRLPKSSQKQFCDVALWRHLYRKPRCRVPAEASSTNTEEGVASSVTLFPASTREKRSTYAFLYIKRFPLQSLRDFFRRAIEFVI